jgi:hypothetical protein
VSLRTPPSLAFTRQDPGRITPPVLPGPLSRFVTLSALPGRGLRQELTAHDHALDLVSALVDLPLKMPEATPGPVGRCKAGAAGM